MELQVRFDYWIDGGVRDNYFHGWPNLPKYKHCFGFKWKDRCQCHRMYGFLIHPTPQRNPRFEVCVLVSDVVKNEWETDFSELDRIVSLRNDRAVQIAINELFKDSIGGGKQWLN